MTFKTLQDIYAKAPVLEDIANRLQDSEEQIKKYNSDNKRKRERGSEAGNTDQPVREYKTRFKQRYPEHYVIDKIFKNGRWEPMAQLPAMGKDNFEKRLLQIITTRNPDGLHIDIYSGKTSSPIIDFTAFLTDDEKAVDTMKESAKSEAAVLGLVEAKLQSWENKLEESKNSGGSSPESIQHKFEIQIMDLKHNQKIDSLTRDFQAQLNDKDREIEGLNDYIDELENQLDEQDAELGSVADKLVEKQKTPAIQTVLTAAIEKGITGVLVSNPKILTKGFGMTDEAVKEIVAEMQKDQGKIEEKKPDGDSSFSEASNTTDEYAGFAKEHAEVLQGVHNFAKSLPIEQFKKMYEVVYFMFNEDNTFNEENAKKMIAHIHTLNNQK